MDLKLNAVQQFWQTHGAYSAMLPNIMNGAVDEPTGRLGQRCLHICGQRHVHVVGCEADRLDLGQV